MTYYMPKQANRVNIRSEEDQVISNSLLIPSDYYTLFYNVKRLQNESACITGM